MAKFTPWPSPKGELETMNKLWTAITEALANGTVVGMTFAQGTITLDLADPREAAPEAPVRRRRNPRAAKASDAKPPERSDDIGDIPEHLRRT
jgi:hypothetical protein